MQLLLWLQNIVIWRPFNIQHSSTTLLVVKVKQLQLLTLLMVNFLTGQLDIVGLLIHCLD